MQNVAMWRFLQFVVYASLILDRLTFHASKEFNSIIAPNKATKQSRDLKCATFLFIIHSSLFGKCELENRLHTFVIEVQPEQYLKVQNLVVISIPGSQACAYHKQPGPVLPPGFEQLSNGSGSIV